MAHGAYLAFLHVEGLDRLAVIYGWITLAFSRVELR